MEVMCDALGETFRTSAEGPRIQFRKISFEIIVHAKKLWLKMVTLGHKSKNVTKQTNRN